LPGLTEIGCQVNCVSKMGASYCIISPSQIKTFFEILIQTVPLDPENTCGYCDISVFLSYQNVYDFSRICFLLRS